MDKPKLTQYTTFELPYPPSGNTATRYGKGVFYTTKKTLNYRKEVKAILQNLSNRLIYFTKYIQLDIELYPPDLRHRDIDNPQKTFFDALQHGGLFKNDKQVKKLNITMNNISRATCLNKVVIGIGILDYKESYITDV